MPAKKRFCWFLLLIILLAVYPHAAAASDSPTPGIPSGFTEIASAQGIHMYRKDYKGGTPDFVQVLDLRQGAALIPLHGALKDPGAGEGLFGGADASFQVQSLEGYWQQLYAQEPEAFCVANGQFFYMGANPSPLPSILKSSGQVITEGHERREYQGQWLMLELWPDHADIQPYSQENLAASTAPNILGGLTEDALKRRDQYTGRTFIGAGDRDGDGILESLMVFSTKSARQVDAASVLRGFGAAKVMMLDGGGSAQLICQGKDFVPSDRPIPQAIGILGGSQEQAAATGEPAAPAPAENLPVQPGTAGAANGSEAVAPVAQPEVVAAPSATEVDQVASPDSGAVTAQEEAAPEAPSISADKSAPVVPASPDASASPDTSASPPAPLAPAATLEPVLPQASPAAETGTITLAEILAASSAPAETAAEPTTSTPSAQESTLPASPPQAISDQPAKAPSPSQPAPAGTSTGPAVSPLPAAQPAADANPHADDLEASQALVPTQAEATAIALAEPSFKNTAQTTQDSQATSQAIAPSPAAQAVIGAALAFPIRLKDALWVPLSMSPVLLFLLYTIGKMRSFA